MSLVLSSSNKALSVAIEENGEFHYYVTDLLNNNMSRLITSDSKEGTLGPKGFNSLVDWSQRLIYIYR